MDINLPIVFVHVDLNCFMERSLTSPDAQEMHRLEIATLNFLVHCVVYVDSEWDCVV